MDGFCSGNSQQNERWNRISLLQKTPLFVPWKLMKLCKDYLQHPGILFHLREHLPAAVPSWWVLEWKNGRWLVAGCLPVPSDSFRAAHGESVLFGTGFIVTFVSAPVWVQHVANDCGFVSRCSKSLALRALWHWIASEHACLSMACGIADGVYFQVAVLQPGYVSHYQS